MVVPVPPVVPLVAPAGGEELRGLAGAVAAPGAAVAPPAPGWFAGAVAAPGAVVVEGAEFSPGSGFWRDSFS